MSGPLQKIRGNPSMIVVAAVAILAALAGFTDRLAGHLLQVGVALLAVVLLGRRTAQSSGGSRHIVRMLTIHMGLMATAALADLVTVALDGDVVLTGATISDPFRLAAYAPLIVAIIGIATRNSSVRLQDLLVDALAVAVVAGLGLWQIIMVGIAPRSDGSLLDRVASGVFPAADVLVVGALAALVFARATASRVVACLAAYGALTLLIDVTSVATLFGAPATLHTAVVSGFTVAFGVLASVGVSREPIHAGPSDALQTSGSVPRLTLLGIAVVCAPALAVILSTGRTRTWAPLLVFAAVAVSLLVMTRVAALVRRLEVEQRRLSATEAHLAYQATHDALTGLPNRTLLTERLGDEVARAQASGREVALMFVDLDDFKLVNDTLGHAAGDDLLRVIAHRIQDEISPGDIVGRVGGDEFVVVSPNLTDRASATRFAETVLAAVAAPVAVDGHLIEPSVSIGIALRGASSDPQVLLANADLALYKAKDSGRCCARMFDQSLRQAADERAGIEAGLRRAVGGREITVEYQPQVDLESGEVASLEALARWPSRPDIPVGRFIEVAETTGIVEQLGGQVLDLACRDIMRLNQAAGDRPVGISVNVSMRQLLQRDLADLVADALRRHGVPHDLLTLEITETFVAQEPELAARTLAEIRALGVRIEVDDFGVGHTSFRSLSHLPIDGIKIDRSLVHGLAVDDATESIVSAILAMAQALGLDTTVEGIETREDLTVVRALGADRGQGYLFSRPVPFDAAARLVRDWPQLCPAAGELAAAMSATPWRGSLRLR